MIWLRWRLALSIVLVAAGAALAMQNAFAQGGGAGDLAIITNPDTPVDQLSFADLRQVLKGERQYWTKDLPVVLFVRAPTSAERTAVLGVIYQMNEAQFKQYWIAKQFRAETVTAPKNLKSSEATQQFVATTRGALGFMAARDVRPGVKVLKIDGRLPSDKGYRLHLTGGR
jgi:ABC-type phosphate transport system substrate-binding protein